MASIFISNDTHIDYSLIDNRVRSFELKGIILYDEDENIVVKDWEDKLIEFVKEQELHINKGKGLSAFVRKLIQEGKI